jgi:7-cyano-7-deazaguanine reductase
MGNRHTRKKETRKKIPSLSILGSKTVRYPSTPDEARLEAFPNSYPERNYWITFDCPEFTSVCPVTGQPDFGKIIIQYIPDKLCLESKSLKLYLFSFRNYPAFHEDVTNRILSDIVRTIKPRQIIVRGEFRPRGGIAITVEVSYPEKSCGKLGR